MINVDSPDFYHSSLLNPSPTSGFGGWGDPKNDLQISDGAFHSDFIVSYPAPHIVRRNFTLQPYLSQNATVFQDGSSLILYDNTRMVNLSITPESQYNMVHGFVADYEGFQALMEGTNVRTIDHSLLFEFTQCFDYRAPTLRYIWWSQRKSRSCATFDYLNTECVYFKATCWANVRKTRRQTVCLGLNGRPTVSVIWIFFCSCTDMLTYCLGRSIILDASRCEPILILFWRGSIFWPRHG